MNNEEFDRNFERKMEFFLHQQARFDADMQRLEEAQTRTEKVVARVENVVPRLSSLVFEGFKITDSKIQALAESQKLTDEKLRELAATVDRHIREGHRGLNGA
jgi:hypothetical protein